MTTLRFHAHMIDPEDLHKSITTTLTYSVAMLVQESISTLFFSHPGPTLPRRFISIFLWFQSARTQLGNGPFDFEKNMSVRNAKNQMKTSNEVPNRRPRHRCKSSWKKAPCSSGIYDEFYESFVVDVVVSGGGGVVALKVTCVVEALPVAVFVGQPV